MSPDNQRLVNVGTDWRVVVFVIVVAILTAIGLGLFPALRISQPVRFKSDHGTRNVLIVSEVALALVLVTGASLLLKSYARVENVSPGMRTQDLITAEPLHTTLLQSSPYHGHGTLAIRTSHRFIRACSSP